VVVLRKPQQLLLQETLMDKYIGFDIDSKKTVACVVQKGENTNPLKQRVQRPIMAKLKLEGI
jgi:hypothetical protein